ncbi:hypothetical protein BJ912DRAFT_972865 [Pholiota molesta]|nr:hypothetical protein BJ912DRAFT_972865 [Pholiota molesta]
MLPFRSACRLPGRRRLCEGTAREGGNSSAGMGGGVFGARVFRLVRPPLSRLSAEVVRPWLLELPSSLRRIIKGEGNRRVWQRRGSVIDIDVVFGCYGPANHITGSRGGWVMRTPFEVEGSRWRGGDRCSAGRAKVGMDAEQRIRELVVAAHGASQGVAVVFFFCRRGGSVLAKGERRWEVQFGYNRRRRWWYGWKLYNGAPSFTLVEQIHSLRGASDTHPRHPHRQPLPRPRQARGHSH